MTDKTARLSERISRLSASDSRRLALGLRYAIPPLVQFLETHHEPSEGEAHQDCRACVLINHIELELGRE